MAAATTIAHLPRINEVNEVGGFDQPGNCNFCGCLLTEPLVTLCCLNAATCLPCHIRFIDGQRGTDKKCQYCRRVITIKASGPAITSCNIVYIMEPSLVPSLEKQALSRIHRQGQERPTWEVQVVQEGSVDENVLAFREEQGVDLRANPSQARRTAGDWWKLLTGQWGPENE
ncbi:hypothetical protein DFJ74DRAFT_652313 [Hyaloraphidium curvatum]|nr:hypothetical protein DFJ74DRAFT_652313 [Hyaloraphidium curvatum]